MILIIFPRQHVEPTPPLWHLTLILRHALATPPRNKNLFGRQLTLPPRPGEHYDSPNDSEPTAHEPTHAPSEIQYVHTQPEPQEPEPNPPWRTLHAIRCHHPRNRTAETSIHRRVTHHATRPRTTTHPHTPT